MVIANKHTHAHNITQNLGRVLPSKFSHRKTNLGRWNSRPTWGWPGKWFRLGFSSRGRVCCGQDPSPTIGRCCPPNSGSQPSGEGRWGWRHRRRRECRAGVSTNWAPRRGDRAWNRRGRGCSPYSEPLDADETSTDPPLWQRCWATGRPRSTHASIPLPCLVWLFLKNSWLHCWLSVYRLTCVYIPGSGRHVEQSFQPRRFSKIVWHFMPRIGWFGSAQRRVTAFPTAETFNSARHLLTHCHPTRHATPVHTCKTNEKEKLKINLTDWIRSISFAARTNLISYFF